MSSASELDHEGFVRELVRRQIKFVVFGGFARYVGKIADSYGDLDLMYEGSEDNIKKLQDFIEHLDSQTRQIFSRPNKAPNIRMSINQSGQKVDILGEFSFAATKVKYEDLIGRSSTVEFAGMKLQAFFERISESA